MAYFRIKNPNLEGLAIEDVGMCYGHLVHFAAIWYILWTIGIYIVVIWYVFSVLVCCGKKNLATLFGRNLKVYEIISYKKTFEISILLRTYVVYLTLY
jgi:hypothetical protein